MSEVIKFNKVRYDIFKQFRFRGHLYTDEEEEYVASCYKNITLPRRATEGSAGYDIYLPFDIDAKAGETIIIPTGISAEMWEHIVLMLYPRSSLGFKYGMRFNNTTPVIDSDFINSDTEGHIILSVKFDKDVELHAGDRIAQGIFVNYYVTCDDEPVSHNRTGGIGSTGK